MPVCRSSILIMPSRIWKVMRPMSLCGVAGSYFWSRHCSTSWRLSRNSFLSISNSVAPRRAFSTINRKSTGVLAQKLAHFIQLIVDCIDLVSLCHRNCLQRSIIASVMDYSSFVILCSRLSNSDVSLSGPLRSAHRYSCLYSSSRQGGDQCIPAGCGASPGSCRTAHTPGPSLSVRGRCKISSIARDPGRTCLFGGRIWLSTSSPQQGSGCWLRLLPFHSRS